MDSRKFVSFVDLKRGEMVVDLDAISYVSTLEPDLYNLRFENETALTVAIKTSADISETKYLISLNGVAGSINISREDYNKIKKILLDG